MEDTRNCYIFCPVINKTKMEDINNVVTDGNNFGIVDKKAKIKAGDTAYSGDIGFYLVVEDDVNYANANHWKVTHSLKKVAI